MDAKETGTIRQRISVVIPAFRVSSQILEVISLIGPEVTQIIVVDDACPEKSGHLVKDKCRDSRVTVLTNEDNLGVGGAVIRGYRHALTTDAEIIVKLDGDGQMDAHLIPQLVKPLIEKSADYSKGNRFWSLGDVRPMPKIRLIGNLVLSFFAKASSGYWNVFDPNNGFTAIRKDILKKLPLDKIDYRYFFESDMLFRLYLEDAKVSQMRMTAKYGDEQSNLKIVSVIFEFFVKHLRNFVKRILYTYYIRDFSVASLNLLLGLLLLLFGGILGLSSWVHGLMTEVPTRLGTQIIVAISILSSLQFLLSFANTDVSRATRNESLNP